MWKLTLNFWLLLAGLFLNSVNLSFLVVILYLLHTISIMLISRMSCIFIRSPGEMRHLPTRVTLMQKNLSLLHFSSPDAYFHQLESTKRGKDRFKMRPLSFEALVCSFNFCLFVCLFVCLFFCVYECELA